ncbi:unnamed protein product [Closterium sp. Yama58-4]|nr:unnamed protein product [Closterium sp. Yama58-4]
MALSTRVLSSARISSSARAFRLAILLLCSSLFVTSVTSASSASTKLHESQLRPLQALSKAWRLPPFAQCDLRSGLTCDAQGMVTGINLAHRNITGVIPKEISAFANLDTLYLYGNNLTGAIPASLGLLANLEALNLGQNALSGSIPLELGNLKALILLNLNGNRLVGNIPETLGKLSKLQHLELGGNALTGPIPDSFSALTNLLTLDLSPNKLSGSIPPAIGALKKLKWMYLSGNQISGSLPPEIGGLDELEHLWIEDNKLTGPIPTEIGNCTSLEILYLSNNSISGSLPDSIGQLHAMRDMRLDNNMLSGVLPPSLGFLSNLTVLALHANQLSGALPATLGKLSVLKALTVNATAQPCPASASLCLVSQSNSSSFCRLCPQFCASCQPLELLAVDNGGESGSDGSGGSAGGGLSTAAIIAVVCGSLLLLTAVLVAFLVWCCCRPGSSPFKHVKVVDQEEFDDAGLIPSLCCRYSLVEIRRATNNWSEESRIGSGQHSDVYKGTCPYNPASTWAVKRYKERSKHFDKEVEQIASKWHPNLAHLLGYCVDSDTRVEGGRMVQVEEQIAVYEYVHHGDLSRYLYQETFRASFALWERVDILIGMAHGLQYLHSVGMVHGDLTPANILIDKSWQAKVSNYGLLQRNEQSAVSAGRLFGTPGYVDPVYLTSHIATKASDVFSFGVIFLELLTGRPPFIQVQAEHGEDHVHIADWVSASHWMSAAHWMSVTGADWVSADAVADQVFHLGWGARGGHVTDWAAPLIDEGKSEELKDPHLDVLESSFLSMLHSLTYPSLPSLPLVLARPSLPTYQAAPLIDEGKTDELKDPHLDVPESSFLSLAELAIRCTAMPFTDRPPMGEVLATLKAIRTDFFGLTDPDDVYGGEGSGGLENGFGGGDGDADGRPDWGVTVNSV